MGAREKRENDFDVTESSEDLEKIRAAIQMQDQMVKKTNFDFTMAFLFGSPDADAKFSLHVDALDMRDRLEELKRSFERMVSAQKQSQSRAKSKK